MLRCRRITTPLLTTLRCRRTQTAQARCRCAQAWCSACSALRPTATSSRWVLRVCRCVPRVLSDCGCCACLGCWAAGCSACVPGQLYSLLRVPAALAQPALCGIAALTPPSIGSLAAAPNLAHPALHNPRPPARSWCCASLRTTWPRTPPPKRRRWWVLGAGRWLGAGRLRRTGGLRCGCFSAFSYRLQ